MIDSWDPRQYDRFQREREQPFFDLLALVRRVPGMRVVDLGCGTGKLTRVLHDRLQAGETTGIDRSDRMLAATSADALPEGLRFEVGTIESFVARAAEASGLAAALAPEGQLAFQVPAQHDGLSHVLAEELTTTEPFRSALGGWHRPQPVLAPEAYARLLHRCGFEDPIVRLIVYPHVLSGQEDVVEWMKGTLLTEYARHLPADLFDQFVQEYGARLVARLEATRPFFFPFKRILCWGQRTGSSRTLQNHHA